MGVYTIYYQTEPRHTVGCRLHNDSVHELWDYSWANIDACSGNPNCPIQRYLPPGLLDTGVKANTPGSERPFIGFFGRLGERKCETLTNFLRVKHIHEIFNIWTWKAFRSLKFNSAIWLNLHRSCNSSAPFEALRMSTLLSSNGLVISQKSYHKDESEFQGLVDFVNQSQLWKAYHQLILLGSRRRLQLAKSRGALYAKKFNPAALFAQSDVYLLLDKIGGKFAEQQQQL